MSIEELWVKIKRQKIAVYEDVVVTFIIIFIGLAAFGLGRLSVTSHENQPVRLLEERKGAQEANSATFLKKGTGLVVASRNGSKYHYPWCSGAQRMNEENKIWFDSIEDARKAGYTPAANCKGLK